jgi:hypothetical protein
VELADEARHLARRRGVISARIDWLLFRDDPRRFGIGYDQGMRISFALIVFAISCGPVNPSSTPGTVPPDETPAGEIAEPLPVSCSFRFVSTTAAETVSGDLLAARGDTTDAASVVTVYVKTSTLTEPVIRYTAGVANCATASFKETVPMVYIGTDPDGDNFSGIIPAFAPQTHVCWKILAPVCGVKVSAPEAGSPSNEYTTK